MQQYAQDPGNLHTSLSLCTSTKLMAGSCYRARTRGEKKKQIHMLGPFSPNPEILHGFPRVYCYKCLMMAFPPCQILCICVCVGKERGFKYHSTSLALQMRGLRQGEILVTSLGSNTPHYNCCPFLAFLPTFSGRGHQSG